MVAAIACAAVLYPSLIAIGAVALGVSLRQDNWIELLMAVPGGVILGALYWLLAGRAEVQAEQERRQDARAIAAMD
jgi:H+/gluconate symporter-like permease